jgi:hypothetical protein
MSKSKRVPADRRRRERRISVRVVRRDPPDLRKLSRALIALAMAQAEADAQAAAAQNSAGNASTNDEDDHKSGGRS